MDNSMSSDSDYLQYCISRQTQEQHIESASTVTRQRALGYTPPGYFTLSRASRSSRSWTANNLMLGTERENGFYGCTVQKTYPHHAPDFYKPLTFSLAKSCFKITNLSINFIFYKHETFLFFTFFFILAMKPFKHLS